jgi:hypothetical protein
VNADVDPNNLRVAILDEKGDALKGFSHELSVAEPHDKLRYRIVWRSESEEKSIGDLSANRPVALEFRLRNGDLFAFQQVN